VANLTGVPGDRSWSLGWLTEAVLPLAIEQVHRATGLGEKIPETSERLVQLVRRQRYRGPRRQVSVAGVERFSRLCVLMNPNPAGRAVHQDLAGEMLENRNSCGPDFSGGTQEVNLRVRSVDEPAHADIHRRAQRQERKQHRRSAVTH